MRMPRRRIVVITFGLMVGLFLASMETTVVATAMPTIASELGGLALYSWAFSAYLLAATTTMPIFGKLSDLYGRRSVFTFAMGTFLVGSLLCARATSMEQLIGFRLVQGLGAGGLMPMVFVMVGDLFMLEQRARVQGLLSGVWGVSSIVGPLLGGFLVDWVSWPWIFYVNLGPGLLSGALVWFAWRDPEQTKESARPQVDYAGAGLLTVGVSALMFGLFELGSARSWALLLLAAILFTALARIERRAPDPVLPLTLFRDRLFAVSCAHGLLTGWALFGSISFVPLFVQAVLGTSATAAGATLTPLLLGWVTASIVGSRLLLRIGYRMMTVAGTTSLAIGMLLISLNREGASQLTLLAELAMMGIGMGLSVPAFLIAVQSAVRRSQMGTATSTLQFSRSIGGTLGVSVMGAVLTLRLAAGLTAAGLDPHAVSLDRLLDPLAEASSLGGIDVALRSALASAIQGVFVMGLIAAALALAVTALAPAGRIAQLAALRAQAEGSGGALAAPIGAAADRPIPGP